MVKRVLHTLNGLNMGGKEMFVMNFYRQLDKNKVQFDFLTFQKEYDYFVPEIISLGGEVNTIDIDSNSIKFFSIVKRMVKTYIFFKKSNYEIVHCHGCSFFEILMVSIPAKLSKRKRIISHSHNPGIPKNTKLDDLMRKLFKELINWSCTDYFACSDIAALSKYPQRIIDRNRVVYIKNAIDLCKYVFNKDIRNLYREKLGISSMETVIGSVGRLENQKNHSLLIDIFKEYHCLNKNSKLLLVGDGSLKNKLVDKVKSIGLENSVVFTGNVDNPSFYYQVMDLFVLTSYYEGLPFVAIEAQCSGLLCYFSNAITEQAIILDTTKQIDINLDPREISCQLEKTFNLNNRVKAYEVLKNEGFDIVDEAYKLTQFYLNV